MLTARTAVACAVIAGLGMSGCSQPQGEPAPPSSSRVSARQLTPDVVRACSTSLPAKLDNLTTQLRVGPLGYARGARFADMTMSEYLAGDTPTADAEGWYFVKSGAVLPAGQSVTVRVDPSDLIRIVGAAIDQRVTTVRYDACPDRNSAWLGGFALRTQSACARLTYTTRGGPSGTTVASFFGGRCVP